VIGIDYGLVVPDASKSLADGAVRPWQTPSYKECQDDLLRFAKKRGIATMCRGASCRSRIASG
jgi:excinuclease ABC subunit A